MTLLLAAVAVPVNTVFGVVAALQLTRSEFAGKTFAMAMLDLPFSISPVVTGKDCPRSSCTLPVHA
jgi:sulfate transport system permease protein